MTIRSRCSVLWLALAVATAVSGCLRPSAPSLLVSRQSPPVSGPATTAVARGTLEHTVTLTGTVVPGQTYVVSAVEPGQVSAVLVASGQQVAAGTPLVRFDDSACKEQVRLAAAAWQAAEARRAQLEGAGRHQEQLRRLQAEATTLVARGEQELAHLGLTPFPVGADLCAVVKDQIDLGYRLQALVAELAAELEALARQGVESAAAACAEAEAVYSAALNRLARATVVAPVDGTVSSVQTWAGTMTSPGQPLVQLIDEHSLEVEVSVPQHLLDVVVAGAEARARAHGVSVAGAITALSPTADPRTRSFTARVRPEGRLPAGWRVGVLVEVEVTAWRAADALLVPVSAVAAGAAGPVVYVWTEERAQARVVATGRSAHDLVEIVSGLNEGERVVVQASALRRQDVDRGTGP